MISSSLVVHGSGLAYELIPGFIEAGIDILNPIQTSARDPVHQAGNILDIEDKRWRLYRLRHRYYWLRLVDPESDVRTFRGKAGQFVF